MRTTIKIVLSIVAFIIGTIAMGLAKWFTYGDPQVKGGGGWLGIFVVMVMIASIVAIWKYNPEKKKKDTNMLDKS